MSLVSRTYTFSDSKLMGSQVESEVSNIATILNDLDGATRTWTNAKVTTLTPTSIVGTTTNDNASAGKVGEYISSTVTSAVNSPGSGTVFDVTSISLTAGDWDVTGFVYFTQNGATWSVALMGVSSTSGNSAAGLQAGDTSNLFAFANSAVTPTDFCSSVPGVRVSLASTTIYYLKARLTHSAGTPQVGAGRISARRMR